MTHINNNINNINRIDNRLFFLINPLGCDNIFHELIHVYNRDYNDRLSFNLLKYSYIHSNFLFIKIANFMCDFLMHIHLSIINLIIKQNFLWKFMFIHGILGMIDNLYDTSLTKLCIISYLLMIICILINMDIRFSLYRHIYRYIITEMIHKNHLRKSTMKMTAYKYFIIKKKIKLEKRKVFDNGQCSICYDEFTNHSIITLLKCGHVYHKKCSEWIETHNKCPLCMK